MWQLDSEATKASSGSTAAATDIGSGTTCGDDERDLDAAVEAPAVAAAVAVVGKAAPSRVHSMTA